MPPEAVLEVTIPGVCHQTAKPCLACGQFTVILGHFDTIIPVSTGKTLGSLYVSECVSLAATDKCL